MKIINHYTFHTKIKKRELTNEDILAEKGVMDSYINKIMEVYKEHEKEEKLVAD